VAILGGTLSANEIFFVDQAATGIQDGSSWINAFDDLQDALGVASPGDEIWVAEGIYHPDQGQVVSLGDRQATFQLRAEVALYGGFPSEGGPWADRDPNVFITVLSGDLLGNDGDPNEIDLIEDLSRQDNSLHVVTDTRTHTNTILEGFTIQGGNANIKQEKSDGNGGGLYSDAGNATIRHCIFQENSCLKDGGAVYISRSAPLIANCQFKNNVANFSGAGACCGSTSHPIITHCLFERNTAFIGAGIYAHLSSTLSVRYCVLQSNHALFSGGGVHTDSAHAQVDNCVMIHNEAKQGGAVSVEGVAALNHCTIAQNAAIRRGGGIDLHLADQFVMTNSIVWGNTDGSGSNGHAQLYYSDLSRSWLDRCCIQLYEELDPDRLVGLGNIDSDPRLAEDGFHLTEGSPCIDAADPNTDVTLKTDIDGEARTQLGGPDIGADESPYAGNPPVPESGETIYADQTATGIQDGSSWENAFVTLQDALQVAGRADQVWVAEGLYRPDQGQLMSLGDRYAAFQPRAGVAIYGGFPSGGGPWTDRDPNVLITVLSGDLLGNDGDPNEIDLIDAPSRQDNSLHVVATGHWVDTGTILDGFVVHAGNANDSENHEWRNGGGLYSDAGNLTVKNCIFLENSCLANGGAIYTVDSNCLVVDCAFKGNVAREGGGGLSCGRNSHSLLRNTLFERNRADCGGGLSTTSGNSLIMSHCIFQRNRAESKGGGLVSSSGSALIQAKNCVFVENHADYGGGVHLNGNMILDHCTLTRNAADIANGGIWLSASSSIEMTNSVVWGNVEEDIITQEAQLDWLRLDQSILGYCCIQFWTERSIGHPARHSTGQGNISTDPLLAADGMHLTLGSPCINAADPNVSDTVVVDIDGQARVQFGMADIGADEFVYTGPVAKAGRDISRGDLDEVILDGTGSWDPWGHALQYTWQQIEGPLVMLDQSDTPSPSFIPTEPNVYVFELKVNSGSVDSEPDTVSVMTGANQAPVAQTESPRYVGSQFILNGSGSHDPDGFGELRYSWKQISGPAAFMADANVATPLVTIAQKASMQHCVFSLAVSDGDLTSAEALQEITVVPRWDPARNTLKVPHFDPNKPTIISFGGGDCSTGFGGAFSGVQWEKNCNKMDFGAEYHVNSYQDYGDILVAFLSAYAPDYRQLVQTAGFSTGGLPAFDVAIYINQTYADPRYVVNRVTMLDAGCTTYGSRIRAFYDSAVPGEACWVDNYSASSEIFPGTLNLHFKTNPGPLHETPREWYGDSADAAIWTTDMFNHGMTAGAFVSVMGPGRNLQLGPDATYVFQWVGQRDGNVFFPGTIEMAFPEHYPARLPEPVTLMGPKEGALIDANGALFTCEPSENAVIYQLIFGNAPDHMPILAAETNAPPEAWVSEFPYDTTYWTIKAWNQFGSSICADPRSLRAEVFSTEDMPGDAKSLVDPSDRQR